MKSASKSNTHPLLEALSSALLGGPVRPVYQSVQSRLSAAKGVQMSKIDVWYCRDGIRRFTTVTLPIRDAGNAFAWLRAHYPSLQVIDTRRSRHR